MLKGPGLTKKKKVQHIGQYSIGKTLGQGSFSKVKLGTDVFTGDKVAIKIVDWAHVPDVEETSEALEREIRIMKLFDHPNIVKLYDIISHKDDRKSYLIMEYVSRGELFDYIVANGRIKEPESRKYFRQLVSAVEYCHAFLVVHRDLKPSNLLLEHGGSIKLVDFGLSNQIRVGQLFSTWCGSLYYSAPEIIEEKRYTGPAVDLWSIGVILYALVNGRLPWAGKNDLEKIRQIVAADVARPESNISDSCMDLIKGCLTVDPLKRFNMQDVRNHQWTNEGYSQPPPCLVPKTAAVPKVSDELVHQLAFLGFIAPNDEAKEKASVAIANNERTQVVFAYHLLLKKPQLPVTGSYLPRDEIRKAIAKDRSEKNVAAAAAAAAAAPAVTAEGSNESVKPDSVQVHENDTNASPSTKEQASNQLVNDDRVASEPAATKPETGANVQPGESDSINVDFEQQKQNVSDQGSDVGAKVAQPKESKPGKSDRSSRRSRREGSSSSLHDTAKESTNKNADSGTGTSVGTVSSSTSSSKSVSRKSKKAAAKRLSQRSNSVDLLVDDLDALLVSKPQRPALSVNPSAHVSSSSTSSKTSTSPERKPQEKAAPSTDAAPPTASPSPPLAEKDSSDITNAAAPPASDSATPKDAVSAVVAGSRKRASSTSATLVSRQRGRTPPASTSSGATSATGAAGTSARSASTASVELRYTDVLKFKLLSGRRLSRHESEEAAAAAVAAATSEESSTPSGDSSGNDGDGVDEQGGRKSPPSSAGAAAAAAAASRRYRSASLGPRTAPRPNFTVDDAEIAAADAASAIDNGDDDDEADTTATGEKRTAGSSLDQAGFVRMATSTGRRGSRSRPMLGARGRADSMQELPVGERSSGAASSAVSATAAAAARRSSKSRGSATAGSTWDAATYADVKKKRGNSKASSEDAEMRTVRGVFKCSTTSSLPAAEIRNAIEAALVVAGHLKFKRKGPFQIKCADKKSKVRLEIELCKIEKLEGLIGVRFSRLQGDTWAFKSLVEELMVNIKI